MSIHTPEQNDVMPFALVRVQDDLYGATVNAKGLYLPYVRDGRTGAGRNTLHWSVNSLVSDHAYGRFNENADGTLKGKFVIIADPRELPAPAGLGHVDTWFRLDASQSPDGPVSRGMSVGRHAIVVAPNDAPVPEGVHVIRYAGGLAERNAAVREVLQSRAIPTEQAGMWGWRGKGDSAAWASEMVKTLYPQHAGQIHMGPHADSIDERIESGASRIAALIERFRDERLFVEQSGAEVPMSDVIDAAIASQRSSLHDLLAAIPPGERIRSGAFYDANLAALDHQRKLAMAINQSWHAVVPPPLPQSPAASGTSANTFEKASETLFQHFTGRLEKVDLRNALAIPALALTQGVTGRPDTPPPLLVSMQAQAAPSFGEHLDHDDAQGYAMPIDAPRG